MKGKLYLGRISDFQKLDSSGVKCFAITKSDKFHGYMDVLYGLAPTWDLLKWHNSNKSRNKFTDGYYERYFKQIKESSQAKIDIKTITDLLDKGTNVALICFCVDSVNCHRGILGGWLEKKGYDVIYNVKTLEGIK